MVAENRFYSLVTDVEAREKQPDTYSDLLNARAFHFDSEGRVVTTLKGMEVRFSITSGFRPIGITEYTGALYLVLLNNGTNQVEIGSYPSPDYTECNGWTLTYQPIKNYTGDVNYNHPDFLAACASGLQNVPRQSFRVDNHFDWTCERRLDVFARESFDGSLNLYIADGETPNVVINTGFRYDTGQCVDRFTSLADITNGNLVQFNETGSIPTIGLDSVGADGRLKAGNYFFFIRYSNQNKATTSFVLPSRPVSVPASPQTGDDGMPDTYGGSKDEETNHSITLNVLGLDTSYQTFQIGYIYYADGFNEAFLINQPYYVNALVNQQVTVTGYEAVSPVETETFLALKPFEKACRTHTEVNNVYYGANWKGRVLHHPDLCEFAAAIVIGESTRIVGEQDIDLENIPDNGTYNGFETEQQVFENVGYFSGETYCYCAVPLFTNGSIGLAYPMQGTDNFDGVPNGSNTKGIYRFSSAKATPFVDSDVIYSKQATFDFSGAVPTAWILENVKKWFIVRCERRPNLMYQGVAVPVYDGQVISQDDYYWNQFNVETIAWTTQRWAPLVRGVDFFFLRDGTGSERREIRYGWSDPAGLGESMRQPQSRKEGMYGIFSLDYMVDNHRGIKLPVGAVAVRIGTNTAPDRIANNGDSDPVFKDGNFRQVGWKYPAWEFNVDQETEQVEVHDVNAFDYNANNGFVSRFDNGRKPIGNGWYWIEENEAGTNDIFANMPMAMPAYIGMSEWDGIDIEDHLVNVYRTDPTTLDINNIYDPVNEFFFPISVLLPNNFDQTVVVGGGDCFVQRSFIKTIHATNNFDEDMLGFIGESKFLTKNIENGYGTMISIVTENRYNAAFRIKKEGNEFFPGSNLYDAGIFAWQYNRPESPFVNQGYQQILPPRAFRGFDPKQFYGDEHYKSRIRYTDPQLIAGQTDSYRNSGVLQSRDFDLQYGAIYRLLEDMNRLYSFQERAVNLHPINERATSETTEGNKIITGQVLGLPDYVDRLSDRIGTQHTFSVVKGMSGIHGIDADRRLWWRVQGNQLKALSIEKGVDQLVRSTIEAFNTDSNTTARIPDSAICSIGIHAVHDRKNKEVIMTFNLGANSKTIVFSELNDSFSHRAGFLPYIYGNINDELFSFSEQDETLVGGWLHDETDERNTFYGTEHAGHISFYVNVQASIEKLFHQQVYNMEPTALVNMQWNTQDQFAALLVATAPFWWEPEYKKRGWHQPIPDAVTITDETNSYNQAGSHLTGQWLLTKLVFNTRTSLLLRDVLTKITEVKQ